MSISLRNSVLLYRPSLSVWTARKLDKNESQRVAQTNGAVDGAANVHKALLPDCSELQAIQKWAGGFRDYVYTHTLPWDDGGWRCGKALAHMQFMTDLADRILCGEALCEELYRVYDQRVAEAQFKLNHLFRQSDYPTLAEVKRRFSFTVEVMPVPNTEDFRVVEGLSQDEADALVGKATTAVEARVEAAMQDAYKRLYEVVSKMATTLEAYENQSVKKFNDTLVSNIGDLVATMPALNITNDPKLDDLARKAQQLTMFAAADLRKQPKARAQAIGEARDTAREILDVLSPPSPAAPTTPAATSSDIYKNLADLMGV
jgi:hypothetical protein